MQASNGLEDDLHHWKARPYQAPLFQYMLNGGLEGKRAICVWHRRAGKDSCSLQLEFLASQTRVGTYWHMLPTIQQGRQVVWDGVDKHGRRMIDQAFPKQVRKATNQTQMKIELNNGSFWQVVGSDNYDRLIGSNPVGVVFSEYSVADPQAWDYIRPILRENNGWAVFIYTPRGRTHGYNLYDTNKTNPQWFTQILTIADTGVMSVNDMEEEIRAGMSREKALQEFMCDWNVGMEGAYYTEELEWARSNGNIGDFPWDPDQLVYTYWDIGMRDHTSVIFVQDRNGTPVIIDHMRERNKGLPDWAKMIKEKPYVYARPHKGPHDIDSTEWGTGRLRSETAYQLGLEFEAVEKIPVQDGIDAARAMLRRCKFNESKTEHLRSSLADYHRQWNAKRLIFDDKPFHGWSSDDSDCFRYFAVDWIVPSTGRILVRDRNGVYAPSINVKRATGAVRQFRLNRNRGRMWTRN